MNAAPEEDLSLLHQYQREWQILRTRHHNVLIEGSVTATNAGLVLLQPHLREPIVRKPPQAPLELPSGEPNGLILEDVATLSVEDQARLLAWLDGTGSRTQVVSTTEQPLFRLVSRGLFDAALYYRLNVILMHVESRDRFGTGSGPRS